MPAEPVVQTGLDRIASGDTDVLRQLRGRKLGLLAHPASIDRRLCHAHDVLMQAGCDVRVLFGPEHGYGGEAQDMIAVESGTVQRFSYRGGHAPSRPAEQSSSGPTPPRGSLRSRPTPRVFSLYGASEESLYPTAEQLDGLDAVVVDLQDVGSRYYTFVWTAVYLLRRAAPLGVQVIVLDRPNPLGGTLVEGAPQRPGYRSFVGVHDVAVRHGMTIGELCRFARHADGLDDAALTVAPMLGYDRAMSFTDTGLPWVLPSPNMPTLDTARVYPGGCLLEGTNLSEGRGTTRPFEIWGAPFLDAGELASRVRIEGAVLRPLRFQPAFHKHAGQLCRGVQVHVVDPERFAPYHAYLRLIAQVAELHGSAMRFRTEPYEFVRDRCAIDLLTGGPEYRLLVERGEALDDLFAQDARAALEFAQQRRPFLLYA